MIRDSKQEHLKFIICCYYYLLLFGDKREVYLLDESAQPVTEKESMGEEKGSIGPRMKYGLSNHMLVSNFWGAIGE